MALFKQDKKTRGASSRQLKPSRSFDWKKLRRIVEYLNGNRDMVLTLGADNLSVMKWHADGSYATNPDMGVTDKL